MAKEYRVLEKRRIMGFTPYDWNENVQHRVDYVENRLRQGSPVVGRVFDGGVLILSVRKSQRKVFEVFDHILFSAMGSQQDVEAIRLFSIDFAHQEGFTRSPDDVSVQRLLAGSLSPTLKKAFGDGFSAPFIFRGLYAELGRDASRDRFTTLNYDGEYAVYPLFAAIAGSSNAEQRMRESLEAHDAAAPSLPEAVRYALEAWAAGQAAARSSRPLTGRVRNEPEEEEETTPQSALEHALKEGQIEVGLIERHGKESRFRLLGEDEMARIRREA